jgi:hypothetical protein
VEGKQPCCRPGSLRQSGKSVQQVRERERLAIAGMLAELDDLHAGRKRFNSLGEIVDKPADSEFISTVRFNTIIEQAPEDPLDILRVPSTTKALRDVRLEADIQALRRALNVRRIGLRADLLPRLSRCRRFQIVPLILIGYCAGRKQRHAPWQRIFSICGRGYWLMRSASQARTACERSPF